MLVDAVVGSPQEQLVVGGLCLGSLRLRLSQLVDELLLYALAILDDVVDAQLQVAQLKGLGDVTVGTYLERLVAVFLLCLGGKQDDGQVLQVGVALNLACQFHTVHDRHHHVRDNQVDGHFLHNVECLLAVAGRHHMVFSTQQLVEQHEQFDVVFDDEQAVGIGVGIGGGGCG